MARAPKNTGRAEAGDKSATARTQVAADEGRDNTATAGAGDTASAAPAADTVSGATGGDTLSSRAADGDTVIDKSLGELLDSASMGLVRLRAQLEEIDRRAEALTPAARELLRQDTLELERFLRARRPSDAPSDPKLGSKPHGQPTRAQAADAVGVSESEVFDCHWNGETLTVVTTAGQKLRWMS